MTKKKNPQKVSSKKAKKKCPHELACKELMLRITAEATAVFSDYYKVMEVDMKFNRLIDTFTYKVAYDNGLVQKVEIKVQDDLTLNRSVLFHQNVEGDSTDIFGAYDSITTVDSEHEEFERKLSSVLGKAKSMESACEPIADDISEK